MSAQAGDEAAPAVMTYYDAAGVLPQCSEGPAGCDLGQHQQTFIKAGPASLNLSELVFDWLQAAQTG